MILTFAIVHFDASTDNVDNIDQTVCSSDNLLQEVVLIHLPDKLLVVETAMTIPENKSKNIVASDASGDDFRQKENLGRYVVNMRPKLANIHRCGTEFYLYVFIKFIYFP